MSKSLLKEQQVFITQTRICEGATRAGSVIAHKIARESMHFTDGEFVKGCLFACSNILCPKETITFDNVSLSRRTIIRRVEKIATNLHDQVKYKSRLCLFFFTIDKSNDIKDIAQLLILFEPLT